MVIVQQLAHQRAVSGENACRPPRARPCASLGAGAGQLFDDRPADIDRDPAHLGSACCFGRGDAALGFVDLLGERGGQGALALGRFGGEPVGGFLHRRLGLRPRLRHCPLKRGVGCLRLGFQPGGARQIVFAPLPAGVDRRRQPRQPDPRHQE